MRRATHESMEAVADYAGAVVILQAGSKKARVLPVVGFPDSPILFQHRASFNDPGVKTAMAYDGLGIKPQRVEYLKWLNQQLQGFPSVPMTEISAWLKTL